MSTRTILIIVSLITLLAAAALVVLTATLGLAPEYAIAQDFLNIAGESTADDADARAIALLSEEMQQYVTQNCPNGSVSECIDAYTPPEWGKLLKAVYRRSIPDGENAWDVLVIATYELGQGFSGVCMYQRVERLADPAGDAYNGWRVAGWSGFISCDESDAGLSTLKEADAPNRAP